MDVNFQNKLIIEELSENFMNEAARLCGSN